VRKEHHYSRGWRARSLEPTKMEKIKAECKFTLEIFNPMERMMWTVALSTTARKMSTF